MSKVTSREMSTVDYSEKHYWRTAMAIEPKRAYYEEVFPLLDCLTAQQSFLLSLHAPRAGTLQYQSTKFGPQRQGLTPDQRL